MSKLLTKQPTVRTARDRPMGARPWKGRGAFVPVSDAAGFARGIATRWRFAGGLLPGADLALLAIRRVGGMGSVHQRFQFGIHLNLRQTLTRSFERQGERPASAGERMRTAMRWPRRAEGPDTRSPLPAVSSPPNLVLRATTQSARWLPAISASVRTPTPNADRGPARDGPLGRMPMTLGRRIHGVEMIELRTRRSIKSVPALEIRVRRDAPARPTQAQPPFAFVDAPASQEIQPRPAAQTPNVRHLADEVLAIIDRRATAARERLERR